MLKTELESLLEKGFSELGVQFGERFYGEQIRYAAAIDDVLGGVSVAEYKARQKALKSGEERLLHEVYSFGTLTKNQWHVYRNTVPFFKRTVVVVPYEISYLAFTESEHNEYERIADSLIPNIAFEVVDIEALNPDPDDKQNVPIVNILSNKNIALSHFPLENNKYLLKCPPGVRERLKHILPLHKKPYDPEKVFAAVMSFLR